jgi:hypothetical protein
MLETPEKLSVTCKCCFAEMKGERKGCGRKKGLDFLGKKCKMKKFAIWSYPEGI